jgi:ribosomal protein L19
VIPSPKSVGAPLSLSIEDSGDTALHGARITQITGTTVFAVQYWELLPVRWVIRTSETTKYAHRFGNPIVFSQLSVGDFLSVEGSFSGTSDSLGVDAKSIKNWSVSTEGSSFEGKVSSLVDQSGVFILTLGDGNTVLVKPRSGAAVTRGVVRVGAGDVRAGDKIIEVTGVYNHLDRSLAADTIKIFQDAKKFAPRNFQGELVRIDATTLPTVIVVRVVGQEYTVYLSDKTEVLRKDKSKVRLERFVVGDTVRFYGRVREAEWTSVDAEVLRTLEF